MWVGGWLAARPLARRVAGSLAPSERSPGRPVVRSPRSHCQGQEKENQKRKMMTTLPAAANNKEEDIRVDH